MESVPYPTSVCPSLHCARHLTQHSGGGVRAPTCAKAAQNLNGAPEKSRVKTQRPPRHSRRSGRGPHTPGPQGLLVRLMVVETAMPMMTQMMHMMMLLMDDAADDDVAAHGQDEHGDDDGDDEGEEDGDDDEVDGEADEKEVMMMTMMMRGAMILMLTRTTMMAMATVTGMILMAMVAIMTVMMTVMMMAAMMMTIRATPEQQTQEAQQAHGRTRARTGPQVAKPK